MKAGTFNLSYNIELIRTDSNTGKEIDRSEISNLIVNTGLEAVAKLLNGVSSTYMRAIAIGTNNTAPSATQTALVTEVARGLATLTYESDYKAKFSKTFTFGSGESYTIREVAVLDNSTSGGVMFNRAIDSGKDVDSDTDLTVNVVVTASVA